MAQLPYINLPQSQAPGIIGDIGDTLVNAARRSQEEKMAAAKMLLEQRQMQAQEAQMRAQEARANAEAARQQSYAVREQHQYEHQMRQEAAGALPKMNEMIAAGDESGAAALGQVHGINFKRVNGMEAPPPAPLAPQPGAAGPIPSPADRDYAATQGGDMNQPDQSGAGMMAASAQAQTQDQQMAQGREQYAAALADHPRLVAEHAQKVEAYKQAKANPIYRGEGPLGPVEFNPGAVRAQKQALQEQTAGQLAQGLPPQYQMRAMALIKSGVPAAEAARQIEIQQKAEEDRNFKQSLADQFQMTAGQKYQVGMAGAGARKAAAGAGPTPAGLPELIGMKEKGASDSEIAARAVALGISPKVWTGPVKEVLRGGALNDRNERAKAALEITGPNGEIGTAHSVRDAGELNKKNQAFDQMKVRLEAVLADIAKSGKHVNPLDVDATQRRESLMASAAAAGRVYNGLGGTDASQRLEAEINSAGGTLGHGLIKGANPEVLQHNLEEAIRAHSTAQAVRTNGVGGQRPAASSAKPAVVHMPDGSVFHLQPDGTYQ